MKTQQRMETVGRESEREKKKKGRMNTFFSKFKALQLTFISKGTSINRNDERQMSGAVSSLKERLT